MDKFKEEIREALETNGRYDAERGRAATLEAVGRFDARLRRAERIAWYWHVGLAVFLVSSLGLFMNASGNRSMLLMLFNMICALAGLIVMKLWYWVVSSKLAVLKEIALLRMDLAAKDEGAPIPPVSPETARASESGDSERDRLRRKQYWALAIVVGAIAAAIASRLFRNLF